MYYLDSDEDLNQYHSNHQPPPNRLQSTLSLKQLSSRRRSNPDIYPGKRRFSTSYSHEDILSNDQLEQIHFDPRYRDYRSASSLHNCNYRSRSSSLNSFGSSGNFLQQFNQFRRISNQSPPLASLPLKKNWEMNPSIFIEEFNDDEYLKSHESKSNSETERNSKEKMFNSNESFQPLNESVIKSFGDLSQIPFIDDDYDSAPCRFKTEDCGEKPHGIINNDNQRNTCCKTVSFNDGETSRQQYPFTKNGKNIPKNPNSIPYSTDKNQLFHGSNLIRANVRPSRTGINRYFQPCSRVSKPSPSTIGSYNDHCSLIHKLIHWRLEEDAKNFQKWLTPKLDCKTKKEISQKEIRISEGKVKSLTTYFNSMPFILENGNCSKSRSTPSSNRSQSILTSDEIRIGRTPFKECRDFASKENSQDEFLRTLVKFQLTQLGNRFKNNNNCKKHHDVSNKIERIETRKKKLHYNYPNISSQSSAKRFFLQKHHQEDEDNLTKLIHIPSEKHRCRSACFNLRSFNKKGKSADTEIERSFLVDEDEDFII